MGVYIKNGEMPKSCVKCRWYYELYDEHCTLGKFLLRKYPTDVSEEPYILDTQRHPDCPLEEIEIVRCGECKHLKADGTCDIFADDNIRPSVSDFCSYGEPRESEYVAKN